MSNSLKIKPGDSARGMSSQEIIDKLSHSNQLFESALSDFSAKLQSMLFCAWDLGQELIAAQPQVVEGEWLASLAAAGIPMQRAYVAMKIGRHYKRGELEFIDSIRQALLLASPGKETETETDADNKKPTAVWARHAQQVEHWFNEHPILDNTPTEEKRVVMNMLAPVGKLYNKLASELSTIVTV